MPVDVSSIREWLIDGGRSSPVPAKMIEALCVRLTEAGIPLWRVGFFIRTLHPDIFGRNFIWKLGEEVVLGTVDFDIQDTPEFNASPLSTVFREGREVRCRADDAEPGRFPIRSEERRVGTEGRYR